MKQKKSTKKKAVEPEPSIPKSPQARFSVLELIKRQNLAEAEGKRLSAQTIKRAKESDEANARCPSERQAILCAVNVLRQWEYEGMAKKILWFYQYGASPCKQRMWTFNGYVDRAVVLLASIDRGALATEIKTRWQKIREQAGQVDKEIWRSRRKFYQGRMDEVFFAHWTKIEVGAIKRNVSYFVSVLVEAVKKLAETAGDKQPNDLITLTVAISKFHVSRKTLRGAVKDKDGRLKDYREKGKPKNSPIMVSESEVENIWGRR